MRAAVAEADRRQDVRAAARGWQRAGGIDEAQRAAIDGAYPDDRSRLGPVFRVLVFGFTVLIVNSFFAVVGLILGRAFEHAGAVLLLLCGFGLVAATELQVGPLRRREGGTESATAVLALMYLVIGLAWLAYEASHNDDASVHFTLMCAVVLFALAGYWWGYELFVAVAGIALFVLLARGPWGRLLWMTLPLVLAPALIQAGDAASLAPAHRRSLRGLAAVALVFLYLAVHLGSWDKHWVEGLRSGSGSDADEASSLRVFFALAPALVPLVTLAWGVVSRRRLLLNLGIVGLLASLVTLRSYVHVAPTWVVLIGGGAAAVALALVLRRFLDAGRAHERYGFTAEALFSDPERRHALELAAGIVSLAPAARPAAGPVDPGYEGGGGRSGGAGASGEF